jgi:CheY-like chemotaxis protein
MKINHKSSQWVHFLGFRRVIWRLFVSYAFFKSNSIDTPNGEKALTGRTLSHHGTHLALKNDRRLRVSAENLVLLVENEASLRRSLTKYLERAGYAFECCSTAREALVLAERLDPSIVIAEYHLSDANGLALLEKLTRMLPDVAAILVSEYDFETVAKDMPHVEVRSFLRKPFDVVELEAALSSAHSKAKLRPVENFQGKLKAEFEGLTGSIFKQGTLRS